MKKENDENIWRMKKDFLQRRPKRRRNRGKIFREENSIVFEEKKNGRKRREIHFWRRKRTKIFEQGKSLTG